MGERKNSVHTLSLGLGVHTVNNLLDDAIDTSHSGKHPNLIADTHLTVRAHIATECGFLAIEGCARCRAVMILNGYV